MTVLASPAPALARARVPSRAASLGVLALSLVAALGIGSLGSAATLPEIPGWYAALAKPAWTPPNAVFGPVWTTLYVLMAVAAWLVWRRAAATGAPVGRALAWHGAQLLLNLGWSVLFFALHRTGLASVEILVMLVALVGTARAFARHSRLAAWLILPTIAWVAYATALSWAVFLLNP